ncbi:hypothetical protein Tco_0581992 [Tanacetum coccineum]
MKSVKETVKIRVCKGGAWERVYEAVSERLEIDANSGFMVTYNSDNDIVKVCDDLEVNEFMDFVVKSSRIVTLCIVASSVNDRQLSTTGNNQQSNFIHATPILKVIQLIVKKIGWWFTEKQKPDERDLLDDEKLQPFGEKVMGSVFGKVKRLSSEDESSESDEDAETTPVKNKNYNLMIIFDGAVSIASAIKNVFPNAFHGRCYRHLLMNLREKCPRFISKEELFWKACKAYRIPDFEERFSTLRDWLPSAANKLDMIGHEK